MILGLDPSTKGTGWAVMSDEGKLIASGAIRPPKACKTVQSKLQYVYYEINKILDEYKPTDIVSEDQYLGKNANTLKTLSQLRGVIMLACEEHNLNLVFYWPNTIKLVTTGSGKANKEAMVKTVCEMFDLSDLTDDDTADAIGAAYTHYKQKETV